MGGQTKSQDVLERDLSWDMGHLEGCSWGDRKAWACLDKGSKEWERQQSEKKTKEQPWL